MEELERLTPRELEELVRFSTENPILKTVLKAVNGFVLILNEQRQVLTANLELLEAINRSNPSCLIGLRPGEVFNCIHFSKGIDGCGTSWHCKTCGAVPDDYCQPRIRQSFNRRMPYVI